MALVIRGGRVVRGPSGELEVADVLVEGERIAWVGAGVAAPPGAEQLDATGFVVIPGLVNAHTHAHNNLLRGLAERWTLEDLLNHGPALNANRTIEDHYLAALLGAVEMLETGCTAAYDLFAALPAPTPEEAEAVARAYADAGLRAVIAPAVADVSFLPLNAPLRALVYAETGASVDTVLVGGRIVVRGGRVLTVDVARLRDRAQAAAERLRTDNAAAWELARAVTPYLGDACRAGVGRPHPINRYAEAAG